MEKDKFCSLVTKATASYGGTYNRICLCLPFCFLLLYHTDLANNPVSKLQEFIFTGILFVATLLFDCSSAISVFAITWKSNKFILPSPYIYIYIYNLSLVFIIFFFLLITQQQGLLCFIFFRGNCEPGLECGSCLSGPALNKFPPCNRVKPISPFSGPYFTFILLFILLFNKFLIFEINFFVFKIKKLN